MNILAAQFGLNELLKRKRRHKFRKWMEGRMDLEVRRRNRWYDENTLYV